MSKTDKIEYVGREEFEKALKKKRLQLPTIRAYLTGVIRGNPTAIKHWKESMSIPLPTAATSTVETFKRPLKYHDDERSINIGPINNREGDLEKKITEMKVQIRRLKQTIENQSRQILKQKIVIADQTLFIHHIKEQSKN